MAARAFIICRVNSVIMKFTLCLIGLGGLMLGSEKKPVYFVIVLLLGSLIAWLIVTGKPEPIVLPTAQPREVVVDVSRFEIKRHYVWLKSQGLVTAQTSSVLSAQVAGRISKINDNFTVGGSFVAGEILLSLEDDDYRNVILNNEAELANAQQLLATERGKVKQAKREWRDLGDQASNDLFLREPQLVSASAAVAAAEANLQQARLNLSRTQVTAPFDGQLLAKHADLGQYVSQGLPLADIYSTSVAEVRLPITSDQRQFITLHSSSVNPVELFATYGERSFKWAAHIDRIEAAVDATSRQYYLVASLKNPFQRLLDDSPKASELQSKSTNPPLAIGQYLTAKIEGDSIDRSVRIPRQALRQQDLLWLFVDGQLVTQPVTVLQVDRDFALVQLPASFHKQNDIAVITSDLLFAFEGMSLTPSFAEQQLSNELDSLSKSDSSLLSN